MKMTEEEKVVPPSYTSHEAVTLFEAHGLSEATFFRWVKQGRIKKYPPPSGRLKGALYDKAQADALIQSSPIKNSRKRNTTHPSNTRRSKTRPTKKVEHMEAAETDWIQESDLPYVFVLDAELYGLENTVSPLITKWWWEKNPYACRILFDKNNRKDIWGALTILPMEEEIIYKLLRDELKEQDITPDMIQSYDLGETFAGYIASVAIRPERMMHIFSLLGSVMDYWYEQYPGIQIKKLYAFALGGAEEENDGIRLIRKLYFAPRYDLSQNAWELNLALYNPSPLIRHFQQRLREKGTENEGTRMSIAMSVHDLTKKARAFTPSAKFKRIRTRKDIVGCLEVADEIFGPIPNMPTEKVIDLWYSWHQKNPDIFHLLELRGRVIGFVSIIPLVREKIDRILREEESPKDISPDEVQEYRPEAPVDAYVHVMGVRPEFKGKQKSAYGMRLFQGLQDVFEDFGRRGIVFRTLITRSRLDDGIHISRHVGFQEVNPPLGIDKRHFLLNVQASDDPFLGQYKQALEEYHRRLLQS